MAEAVAYPKVEGDSGPQNSGSDVVNTKQEEQQEIFGVLVTDLSPQTTEVHLREFFKFSGQIKDVLLSVSPEGGHQAKILFEKQEDAETACLLTGAIILDQPVVIANLFDGAPPPVMGKKAVDVISTMLSQGFVFGKQTFDKLAEFDKKIGLSEKVKANVASAKAKFSKMDEKYQFTNKAKGLLKGLEGKLSQVDNKFKISERFNSKSQNVKASMGENKSVQKVTKGIKYGFSTMSANISKVSNATTSRIKSQLGKQTTNPNPQ